MTLKKEKIIIKKFWFEGVYIFTSCWLENRSRSAMKRILSPIMSVLKKPQDTFDSLAFIPRQSLPLNKFKKCSQWLWDQQIKLCKVALHFGDSPAEEKMWFWRNTSCRPQGNGDQIYRKQFQVPDQLSGWLPYVLWHTCQHYICGLPSRREYNLEARVTEPLKDFFAMS